MGDELDLIDAKESKIHHILFEELGSEPVIRIGLGAVAYLNPSHRTVRGG
jgi:hypothetical protein